MKATLNLKAVNMQRLMTAIEKIIPAADESIVIGQAVTTSITIEARSMKHLQMLLTNVAGALSLVGGVEVSVKTPMQAYHGLRLDTTPIERAIAQSLQAEPDESPVVEPGELPGLHKFRDFVNGVDDDDEEDEDDDAQL